jgi:hypothetical protein
LTGFRIEDKSTIPAENNSIYEDSGRLHSNGPAYPGLGRP